eukprot:s9283_g2.t1
MIEQTDETAPRKLSVPERAERHNKIAKRLPGLDIRNRHEPSDSLVDMFVAQYEQNRIQFVEWDRLTSKEQEASSNAKKETVLSVDSSGRLKTEKGDSARAETSTELLLQFALTRRGRLKTEKGDSARAETSTELLLQFALTRKAGRSDRSSSKGEPLWALLSLTF